MIQGNEVQNLQSNDIATWVIAVATVVYTLGSLALWLLAFRQLRIMQNQQRLLELDFTKQTKYLDSALTHTVIDSHRDIFFEIVKNKELARIFARNSNSTIPKTKERILASVIINHAYAIWLDYTNGLKRESEFENFSKDFADVLATDFIDIRWNEVKDFHSQEFNMFVESLRIEK